jgi:hypothetical protein
LITGLVNRGLASVTREQVETGGKVIEVMRVRIAESGRDAVAAETSKLG